MNWAEWATAFGEAAIAYVILREMEDNRRDRFLAEAAKIQNYRNRGKLYSAFYNTGGQSTEEKARRFCDDIWKNDGALRRSCEQQIVLLNRLGQIRRHASLFKEDYVTLFPHAVVICWVVLEPYIAKRRKMTGDWWAMDFERLAGLCLDFVLDNCPAATLRLSDPKHEKDDFVIRTDELRQLEQRLKQRSPRA